MSALPGSCGDVQSPKKKTLILVSASGIHSSASRFPLSVTIRPTTVNLNNPTQAIDPSTFSVDVLSNSFPPSAPAAKSQATTFVGIVTNIAQPSDTSSEDPEQSFEYPELKYENPEEPSDDPGQLYEDPDEPSDDPGLKYEDPEDPSDDPGQPQLELTCDELTLKSTCIICCLRFKQLRNMNRHMRKVHGADLACQKRQITTCPLCKERFEYSNMLDAHFFERHDITIDKDVFEVDTLRDFKEWKERMERESRSFFRIYHSAKSGLRKMYVCNRTGVFVPKKKGEKRRELKVKGSKKIGGTCPARITMHQDVEGKILVTFFKSHVGHEPDIGALGLTLTEKQFLASKMAQGVPKQVILDKILENFNPEKRMSYTTLKDLHNIAQSFCLDKPIKLEATDSLSLDAYVQYYDGSAENPIILYQPQRMSPNGQITNDDFMLGYMDLEQQELFEMHGSDIVMIGSTHGSNPNDIKLTTVMVVDDNCEGLPVAFLFSVSETEDTFIHFFSAIKLRLPCLAPRSFMTSDLPVFYSAWRKVFAVEPQRLLCTWHMKKNLFENLVNIPAFEKRTDVQVKICNLVEELDKKTFEKLLGDTVQELQLDPDTKAYGDYFYSCYCSRTIQWAHCHRLNVRCNTNMALERWHRELRNNVYVQGQCQQELDGAFQNVLRCVKHKFMNRTGSTKRELPQKLADLRKRHKASLAIPVVDVEMLADDTWIVPASATNQKDIGLTFRVRVSTQSCKCPIQCNDCHACIHNFSCECYDHEIKNQMCEHIHAVCRLYPPDSHDDVVGTDEGYDFEGLHIDANDIDVFAANGHDTSGATLKKRQADSHVVRRKHTLVLQVSNLIEVINQCSSKEELDVIARNIAPIIPEVDAVRQSLALAIAQVEPVVKKPRKVLTHEGQLQQPVQKKRKIKDSVSDAYMDANIYY